MDSICYVSGRDVGIDRFLCVGDDVVSGMPNNTGKRVDMIHGL